jgi:hypothetical protein
MNILDTSAAFPYIHFFEQQVRGFAPIGILASGSESLPSLRAGSQLGEDTGMLG